jgi:fatty acid desaturase
MTNLNCETLTSDVALPYAAPLTASWPNQADTTRSLRQIVPAYFVAKLAALTTLLTLAIAGILATDGLKRILFQVCLGAVMAHATELIHQCLHRTATGRASRDQFVGMILATPVGISFWRYLSDHFRHHRDVTMESFSYNYQRMDSPSVWIRISGFLRHVSMIDQFLETFRWIGAALTGRVAERLARSGEVPNKAIVRRITRDYQIMFLLLLLALFVSLVFRTDAIIQLWLIPVIIGWAPVHALIELPEHWGCETSSRDPRLNTRSIRAGWLARWFVNNNCNHVGHHHDLNVAMERLPDYESLLMHEAPFKYFEESYPRFYLRFFNYLFTGRN